MISTRKSDSDVSTISAVVLRWFIAVLMVAVLMPGCGGKPKPQQVTYDDEQEETADQWDDDTDEELADELLEEEVVPAAAEELFDDFFFLFASNRKLQMERIALQPADGQDDVAEDSLAVTADTVDHIDWQMNHFFINQDYYTVIFDRPEFMDFVKDTAVSEAVVEHIDFASEMVNQYLFDRQQGLWMLRQVVHQPIDDNPNASFLRFYHRFVTDSMFQRESLADEIEFHGADPDNEDSELDGLITPDFWDAFAPELPQESIYNIIYDRHQDAATRQKIFVLRGVSNGSEMEITFSKEQDAWKLKKLME